MTPDPSNYWEGAREREDNKWDGAKNKEAVRK